MQQRQVEPQRRNLIETYQRRRLELQEKPPAQKKGERKLRIFFDIDLRCSHDGLAKVAMKGTKSQDGMDVSKLEPGQYAIFLNRGKDRAKLYAAYGVLSYIRAPIGKLDLMALSLIPDAFNGTPLTYDGALKKRLLQYFAARGKEIIVE